MVENDRPLMACCSRGVLLRGDALIPAMMAGTEPVHPQQNNFIAIDIATAINAASNTAIHLAVSITGCC